jgi:hypothetical protein
MFSLSSSGVFPLLVCVIFFFFTFEFSPLIHVFRCVYCFCSASLTLKVVAPLPMMMVFSAKEAYEREEEGVLRK